jgi:hypothetical protein
VAYETVKPTYLYKSKVLIYPLDRELVGLQDQLNFVSWRISPASTGVLLTTLVFRNVLHQYAE